MYIWEPQTESSALPAALERSLDLYFANGWSRDWQREHDRLMLQEVDRRISAAYTDLRECNAKVIYAMEQRILAKVARAAREAHGIDLFAGHQFNGKDFADELEGK